MPKVDFRTTEETKRILENDYFLKKEGNKSKVINKALIVYAQVNAQPVNEPPKKGDSPAVPVVKAKVVKIV